MAKIHTTRIDAQVHCARRGEETLHALPEQRSQHNSFPSRISGTFEPDSPLRRDGHDLVIRRAILPCWAALVNGFAEDFPHGNRVYPALVALAQGEESGKPCHTEGSRCIVRGEGSPQEGSIKWFAATMRPLPFLIFTPYVAQATKSVTAYRKDPRPGWALCYSIG